jgi:hypothetical protein
MSCLALFSCRSFVLQFSVCFLVYFKYFIILARRITCKIRKTCSSKLVVLTKFNLRIIPSTREIQTQFTEKFPYITVWVTANCKSLYSPSITEINRQCSMHFSFQYVLSELLLAPRIRYFLITQISPTNLVQNCYFSHLLPNKRRLTRNLTADSSKCVCKFSLKFVSPCIIIQFK